MRFVFGLILDIWNECGFAVNETLVGNCMWVVMLFSLNELQFKRVFIFKKHILLIFALYSLVNIVERLVLPVSSLMPRGNLLYPSFCISNPKLAYSQLVKYEHYLRVTYYGDILALFGGTAHTRESRLRVGDRLLYQLKQTPSATIWTTCLFWMS